MASNGRHGTAWHGHDAGRRATGHATTWDAAWNEPWSRRQVKRRLILAWGYILPL